MHLQEEEAKKTPEELAMLSLKVPDPVEEGKIEDQKRRFMTPLRPHEHIWNFQYDDEAHRPKHILRPNADPRKAYIDGRVERFMALIDQMAESLKTHNEERWNTINNYTIKIFVDEEKLEAL